MVHSMTGFGRFEGQVNGRNITLEIKSVNHRYTEFSCRTSRGYAFLEEKLKNYITSKVARGKIDMFVSITEPEDTPTEVLINHNLALGYLNALKEIEEKYNLPNKTSVMDIARYPDVLSVHKSPENEEKVFEDVLIAVNSALESFMEMREAEGKRLKDDVLQRADRILELVSKVEERSPQTVIEYQERLKAKIEEFLQSTEYDQQRVITEVAIYADKVAVSEETVRLRSHIDQLNDYLNRDEPVGRSIDFLVQEMNREANTIGSKARDTQLAQIVIQIKNEIEKIREQIQNIE